MGKCCNGFSSEELTSWCNKYKIFKEDGSYIKRSYSVDDWEETGSYLDAIIKVLDDTEFICIGKFGEEQRLVRVR
jgi:hypothetical protein